MTQQITRKSSQYLSVPQMDQNFHYYKPLLTEKKVGSGSQYQCGRHDLLVSLSCVNSKNPLGLFTHFPVELSSEKDVRVLDDLFFYISNVCIKGLPRWPSGEKSTRQCRRHRRHRLNPWLRKTPWRRKWQFTPEFLPGKSHGQRSLVGYI